MVFSPFDTTICTVMLREFTGLLTDKISEIFLGVSNLPDHLPDDKVGRKAFLQPVRKIKKIKQNEAADL